VTRQELKVCGNGGQGVITMGMLLTQTAIGEGTHAVCTESYGPQSRGGDVWVEVVLDKEQPVDYPRVTKADGLVVLNSMSHRLYARQLKPGGLLFFDPSLVGLKAGPGQLPVACFQAAAEVFQRPQVANLIMLGAVVRLLSPVSEGALERAVTERYPKFAETNLKALRHGYALAEEAGKGGANGTT
jgi:2-oxoglutarate ferredoxin oxidoreductase subunit gamma